MDEVMKALSETRDDKAETSLLDDKSPLLERSPTFTNGNTSFTNIAMAAESDSVETDTETESEHRGSGFDLGSLQSSDQGETSQAMDSSLPWTRASPEEKKKPKLKLVSI